MYPQGYSRDECNGAVDRANAIFKSGYSLDISYNLNPAIPSNKVVLASKGVHHWAWKRTGFYFHPDVAVDTSDTLEEIKEKFKPGYRISVEYTEDVVENRSLKVSQAAAKCWTAGTDLLITSHTHDPMDDQAATVVSADATTGIIVLNKAIQRPITVQDDADQAVEVASLSRNVVFEATSNANDTLIGGHFISHHTQARQWIEGIEITNFGQQGRLGRYPLHFHKCSTQSGSKVLRNSVRDSNQRCYVIHWTDDVLLKNNVAYNVSGHCYFLEHGSETGSTFEHNLVARNKFIPRERVALLEKSSKREETDDFAAGFWISNANNTFLYNVAAGGQKGGIWFETRRNQDKNEFFSFTDLPSDESFIGNEVHSSGHRPFTIYSPGWTPQGINVIKDLKVYRNPGLGAFLHVGRNLIFNDGLFADNGGQSVWIFRADDIVFNCTTFVGQSKTSPKKCSPVHKKVGILLHPARLQESVIRDMSGLQNGLTLRDVSFASFAVEKTGCPEFSQGLAFGSRQTFVPAFSAPHRFYDVRFDHPELLNAEMNDTPEGRAITNLALEIVTDSHNAFSDTGAPGFLVSPAMVPIAGVSCTAYNSHLKWCRGACLRTVSVLTGSYSDDIVMVVTNDDNSQETVTIDRKTRGEPEGNGFASVYALALPRGNFTAQFVHSSDLSTPVWPGYAFPVFEHPPHCPHHAVEEDFRFEVPTAGRPQECSGDLIHNGDFETGIEGWQQRHASIVHEPTLGVNGSGALRNQVNIHGASYPLQYLDTTCLLEGDKYQVTASFVLKEGPEASDPTVVKACSSPQSDDCPRIQLEYKNFVTTDPTNKHLSRRRNDLVFFDGTYDPSGTYNLISGEWTVTSEQAAADIVDIHVVFGAGTSLLLDNVSVVKKTLEES